MKTTQCLNLLLVIVLLHTPLSDALVLEFGEADFSLREDRGPLPALVVARGGLSGSVTVEVIPMTIGQFKREGLSPLPDDLGSLDHAEQGDDFNDSSITLTLQGQLHLIEKNAYVNIVDDAVSEYEEVFLLVLRVVNATEEMQIEVGRNVSVARIRQDNDAFQTRVAFSVGSLTVNEGGGLLNDTLFIEMVGVTEPTLYFQISASEGIDDIRLESNISIPSGVGRVAVPLDIMDDAIVEDPVEYFTIRMSSSPEQQSLFVPGAIQTVFVEIVDNDRPHFGFEVDLPPAASGNSNTSRQLLEGRSAKVCALLLAPSEFETDVQINIQISSGSGSRPVSSLLKFDGLEERGYLFSRGLLRHCFNISSVEDDDIRESSTVTFSLVPEPVFLYPNEVERVDTDVLQVVIRDNDGIPNTPSDIKLELISGGKDLLITWRAEQTPLQPISRFLVTLKTSRSRRSVIGRSPRQANDIEIKPVVYTTTDTRLTLENVETERTYTVQVCAENDLGQACAPAEEFTIKLQDGKRAILQRTSSAAGLELSNNVQPTSLPLGYIIAIVILPSLLMLAICILIILVVLCSCYRHRSKNYYPSKQEKGKEQQSEDLDERLDGRYVRTTSIASISSTTSSVSEFTPV